MTNPLDLVAHQLHSGDVVLAIALGLFTTWVAARLVLLLSLVTRSGLIAAYARISWQVATVLGLEQAYEFLRGGISPKTDVAIINAYRIIDFEWRHGFFVESRLERYMLHYRDLMTGIDLFYILSHAVVTIGVVVAICLWRREHYPFVRNMLLVTTGLALIVFYLYPTAPPRMLPNYGFVDPLVWAHLSAAGGSQAGSYTYNPYAAMPSLHVGYALVAAWSVFVAWKHPVVRAIALLYPVAMAAAVVLSANHFLLDVAGAVLTVVSARTIVWAVSSATASITALLHLSQTAAYGSAAEP